MPNAPCPMPHAPCPMPYAPCPMPHAPCPMPHAPCPMPHALCPMPARAPHVTEKGYKRYSTVGKGRVKQNVLPSPKILSAQILPPCRSTILRQIAKPKPVPPFSRESEASTC